MAHIAPNHLEHNPPPSTNYPELHPTFTNWTPIATALFGHQPLLLEHNLHHSPLFARDTLAELIERYPTDRYTLTSMGAQGDPKQLWQRGTIGKLSGERVIEAIEQGRLWINLLHVNEIDGRYQALLDAIYDEVHQRVPGHAKTFKRINGILISSPRAQVYYHFDTSGQNLWQIHGSKQVYLYPASPPFLTQEDLERVTLYHDETSIRYEPWYDRHATVLDLKPGMMAHWPLNMPHRIENGDALSVSMTTEFYTKDIQRHVRATSGQRLLREMHVPQALWPQGRVGYAVKLAAFAAAKKAGLLEAKRRKPVTFDLEQDGGRFVIVERKAKA